MLMTSNLEKELLYSLSFMMVYVVPVEMGSSIAARRMVLLASAVSLGIVCDGVQVDRRYKGWGGGLSEHIVIPRQSVYTIPESVSMEVGGKL